LLTLLGVVGLVGLASLISLGVGPRALEPIAWVLVGAAPLLLLREYIRQLCLAHLHMVTVVLLDSFVSVLQLGCLAALGYLGALTVGRAYVVMGLACAVPCLAWFLLGQPALRLVASQWLSDWKHNWAFSRWTLSSFLIGSTTPYLMPWVVALIHGEQATGVLAACQTLVNLAGTYVTGVTHVLTPQAARAFADGGFQALRQVLRRTAVLFGVTLGLFCLAVLCAGDLPAILVYGDRYTQVGMVLTVLALNTLTNSLGITAGNGLWVLERPWANLRADVWAFLGTFSGAIFFVPRFGVLGAALALLTGTSVGVLIRCLTLFRLMRELQGRQVSLTQGEAA
jgi:O-antigen/teichoic acid export membrane protein